jgi:hypothetical protein
VREHCPAELKTIAEARRWIIESAVALKACKCPVCGQTAKLYPRKLSAGLARLLVDICRQTKDYPPRDRWVNISKDLIVHSDHPIPRDYSILRFWGLLEPAAGCPAHWRITDTGIAFVEGRMEVPRLIYLYNNNCIRMGTKTINCSDALKSEFRLKPMLEEEEIE